MNDAIRISILLIIQGEATQNYNKTIRPERKKMRIPKWTLFKRNGIFLFGKENGRRRAIACCNSRSVCLVEEEGTTLFYKG